MSPLLIALMFGVGVAAYVWAYLARHTGNARVGSVLGGAAIVGFIAFFVFYTILKLAFNL
jgi:hypothetical protein